MSLGRQKLGCWRVRNTLTDPPTIHQSSNGARALAGEGHFGRPRYGLPRDRPRGHNHVVPIPGLRLNFELFVAVLGFEAHCEYLNSKVADNDCSGCADSDLRLIGKDNGYVCSVRTERGHRVLANPDSDAIWYDSPLAENYAVRL